MALYPHDKDLHIENTDSEVEIVPYLGNVGETMSSSEDSDQYDLVRKRKIEISKRKRQQKEKDGYESNESSSSVEVLSIKFPKLDEGTKEIGESFAQNQMGDKQCLEIMFQDQMKENVSESKDVCISIILH